MSVTTIFSGAVSTMLGYSVLSSAAMSANASAQTAADQSNTLADIVVTAQKREQSLQAVPISVTALAQDALQTNRVTSLVDVGSAAPGVTVRNTPGGVALPTITIRGTISAGGTAGQDRAVSINVDGVYIGTTFGSSFDLPDLERIEILRGPQGTLFGRNSTAGAINIITRDPAGKFGVRQEVTIGNYDQIRSVTRVELPAMGPFSASASYVHDERKGDIRNLGAGTVWDRTNSTRQGIQVSPKTLGDKNSESLRFAVKFEPSDSFNTVYKFDRTTSHYTPEGSGLVVFTPEQVPGLEFLRDLYNAYPTPVAGIHRPSAVNNSWTTPGYLKAYGHNVTSNLHVSEQLSLKNIFAYRSSYVYANTSLSGLGALGPVGTPIYAFESQTADLSKQWSDELQLNYKTDLLTLTAGALYFKLDTETGSPDGLTAPGNIAFAPLPGNVIPAGRDLTFITSKSLAAYAQAEVHVTPEVDIVTGYRITRDKKSGTAYIGGAALPFTYRKTKPSYELGANYRPTNDLMVYGKYAVGFISGGSVAGEPFDPETAQSWEVGLKSDFLDRRLRANLAAFTVKYKHVQQTVPGYVVGRLELPELITDLGDARAKGFEAEVTALPTPGLTLGSGLSYTKFEFTRVNPIFGTPDTFPVWLRPSWTANMSASYESEPLFGEARLTARLDASWRSKLVTPGFFGPVPGYESIFRTGNDWLVNGRLALKDIEFSRGTAEFALWARNLLDNDKPLWAGYQGYAGATTYTPARTFGVDVIFNY